MLYNGLITAWNVITPQGIKSVQRYGEVKQQVCAQSEGVVIL